VNNDADKDGPSIARSGSAELRLSCEVIRISYGI